MGDMKKVSVKIQGREYRVNCTEEEEYIQKIAYYLDKKLGQVMSSNQVLDTLDATILVALNLTDDLFKSVKTIEKLTGKSGMKVDSPFYNEIEKIQKEKLPLDSENSLHN